MFKHKKQLKHIDFCIHEIKDGGYVLRWRTNLDGIIFRLTGDRHIKAFTTYGEMKDQMCLISDFMVAQYQSQNL